MSAVAVDRLQQLDLGLVDVHELNPRKDVGDLKELAASIDQIGVVEPIVVVERDGRFKAVAGSRRLAASKLAGQKSIPARVMSLDDAQAAAAALIENLQRKDLNPLEEAQAFAQYIALTGCTHKALGQKIGRAESTVSNALRLLEAPKPVKEALAKGSITAAHARVALELKDPAYVSKLRLTPGITVDNLKMDVNQANRVYERQGPPAIAAVKKALEAAKAAHPKETVTWGVDEFGSPDRFVLNVLGKPSEKIQGRLRGDSATKSHDKDCTCRAWAIIRVDNWSSPRIETPRACIDARGWNKFSGRKPRPTTRQVPTKVEREKAQREGAVLALKCDRSTERDLVPANVKTHRALAKRPLQSEIARVVLFALICEGQRFFAPTEQLYLWELIARMPLTKVRTLIVEHALDFVWPHVYRNGIGDKRPEKYLEPLLAHYKLTLADAGYSASDEAKKKAVKR